MTYQFEVKSKENSTTGGIPMDTGINVKPGDLIVANCSPSDIWSAGANANLKSNANGLGNPIGGSYGYYTRGDFKFLYGSLVGSLDGGKTLFAVGTNMTMTVLAEGILSFLYCDQNKGDNSGSVTVTVQIYKGPQA